MAKIKLSPPWAIYAAELTQLFKFDSEVHVVYDEEKNDVRLYVDSPVKAAAIGRLLPDEKEFGNVTLSITVVPPNGYAGSFNSDKNDVWEMAFDGNGAFSFVRRVHGVFATDLVYVVFKNKVVQYFNDDLGDVYGQCSTLYQEIAKHVFPEREGVFFCTDVEEPVYESTTKLKGDIAAPLGEWP